MKVYLVIVKDKNIIAGCFLHKSRAERYITKPFEKQPDYVTFDIQEIEVYEDK